VKGNRELVILPSAILFNHAHRIHWKVRRKETDSIIVGCCSEHRRQRTTSYWQQQDILTKGTEDALENEWMSKRMAHES
jgi:hypothetical protein